MDNLKDFIEVNKSSFSQDSLPEGDVRRFSEKLGQRRISFHSPVKRRSVSLFRVIAFPVAAAVALMLVVNIFVRNMSSEEETTRIYTEYCREVAQISSEIQVMMSGDDIRMADRTIDNITFEAIPFIEQLPSEMSKKEKVKAVKEYYSQKLDGVRRFKTLVADSNYDME